MASLLCSSSSSLLAMARSTEARSGSGEPEGEEEHHPRRELEGESTGARGEAIEKEGRRRREARASLKAQKERRASPPPWRACQEEEGARAKRAAASGEAPLLFLSLRLTQRPEKPEGGAGSSILRSLASPSMQKRRASLPWQERRSSRGRGSPFLIKKGTARAKPCSIASRARAAPPGLSAAREAVVWMPAALEARRPARPYRGALA